MTLHHVSRGTGAPLVVLHGSNVDHRLMLPLVEPLFGADDQVLRLYPDLPGMGRSPAEGAASAKDAADALEAWLDDVVGDEPFLLVGFSLGGLLARELRRRRPEQVRGLALLAPVVVPDKAERDVPEHEPLEVDQGFIDELTSHDADAAKEFTRMAVVQTRPQYAAFADQVVPGMKAADAEAVERIGECTGLPDVLEPQPWDRPVLVVCGRQDSIVGWRDQLGLLDAFPRGTFAILDRAGHNVHLESQRQTQRLLEAWLVRCDADVPAGA